jgi:hypothetical protein
MPLIPASWEDHQGQPWAKKDKKSTKPYLKNKAKKKKKKKEGWGPDPSGRKSAQQD